jgi:hypothetical protein
MAPKAHTMMNNADFQRVIPGMAGGAILRVTPEEFEQIHQLLGRCDLGSDFDEQQWIEGLEALLGVDVVQQMRDAYEKDKRHPIQVQVPAWMKVWQRHGRLADRR